MSFFTRSALFLFIVFFSSVMVLMGAREMRARLKPPASEELARAEKLVHALRGDELFRTKAKYDEESKIAAPQRQQGSYLPEYDMKRIKGFLLGLIGGGGAEQSSTASND